VTRAVVVVVVVTVLLFAGATAASAAPGSAPSPADLEAELVCPTCKTTLDQSDAPVARRMKLYIRERLAAGATAQQVKDELVEQFGAAVLAEPPKRGFDLLAWLLPLAGVGLGGVAVGLLARSWSRRREPSDDGAEEPLDPELERRLDEELARFEP